MSRFEQNLTVLGVKKWNQIHQRVTELSKRIPENDDALVAEFARLSRVTEFLAATVESSHPFAELISHDIQNHVTNFEARLGSLRSTNQNQVRSTITQLNDEATTILSRLSPYLSNAESARAAGQVFGRYKRLVEAEEKNIHSIATAVDKASKDIEIITDAIKTYRIELLEDTNEKKSIYSEIKEKISQIDSMLSKTESFYQKLTKGDAESASIENQILEARNSAVKASEEINKRINKAEKQLGSGLIEFQSQ